MLFDHLTEIAYAKNHALHSCRRKQLELPIHKWPPGDFDEGLGNPFRERAQSCGKSASENRDREHFNWQWIWDRMNRIHRIGDRELGIAGFEVITFGNSEIDSLRSPFGLLKAVFLRSASVEKSHLNPS
jgi:hypothetical protein